MTQKPSLIVIEDDPFLRESLYEFLEMEDFQVLGTFPSTQAAREFLASSKVDVVLTDNDVESKGAGLGLLRDLRPDPRIGRVLMSGGNVTKAEVKEAGGPTAQFVKKPFELDTIVDAVMDAASQAKLASLGIAPREEGRAPGL